MYRRPLICKTVQVAFVLPFIVASAVQAGVVAGPIVNPGTGSSYYLREEATWIHSQFEARELGGNLATIEDASENQWIIDTFNEFDGVTRNLWIGLNDTRVPDTFEWISGSSAGFRAWAGGQPDDFFGQQYVAISRPGFLRGEGWGDWADGSAMMGRDRSARPNRLVLTHAGSRPIISNARVSRFQMRSPS